MFRFLLAFFPGIFPSLDVVKNRGLKSLSEKFFKDNFILEPGNRVNLIVFTARSFTDHSKFLM
jgi:hypothetical protein